LLLIVRQQEITKKYNLFSSYRLVFSAAPLSAIINGLCSLITGAVTPLRAFLLLKFIDSSVNSYTQNTGFKEVLPFFVFLIALFFISSIVRNLNELTTLRINLKLGKKINEIIRNKYIKLEYKYIEDNSFHDLLKRIHENPVERFSGIVSRFYSLVASIIRLSGIVILLFMTGWIIGITILVLSFPLYFISLRLGKKLYQWWKENSHIKRRYTYFEELLRDRKSSHERKMFHYYDYISNKWKKLHSEFNVKHVRAQLKTQFKHHTANLVNVVFEIFIYIILLTPLVKGIISIGYIVAVSNSLRDMHFYMQAIGRNLFDFSADESYMNDINKFMDLDEIAEVRKIDPAGRDRLIHFESIEFINVSFRYPGSEKNILKKISFKIERNKHYSIVGVNGAGKSTLIKLILRLYKPTSGKILINGIDIYSIPRDLYIKMFTAIFQDFARYYLTLKENIVFGNMKKTDDNTAVIDTLKTAGFNKDIRLDTVLGKIIEGGIGLSGGEWQRIAIARALLSPAHILILDEPTAALDPVAEADLYTKFNEITKNRITLFISHRLGSTKIADKILVLDNGIIAENGTHEDLMAHNKIYAAMFNKQKSWYET